MIIRNMYQFKIALLEIKRMMWLKKFNVSTVLFP